MADVSALGNAQSFQGVMNVSAAPAEQLTPLVRELDKQQMEALQLRRIEKLKNKGRASSEKVELQRGQTPDVEELEARRGEDAFRGENPRILDILA